MPSLATILAACGGGGGGGGESGQGGGEIAEITWALPGFPNVLLIAHDWSTYSGAVMSLAQEGLLAFGDDLGLTAGLADTWEQKDPTTFVYHIRDGAQFHDGSAVTAEDVAYSMSWNMLPASASQLATFYGSVDKIEATGANEVTVTLSKPDAQYQYTPAHMAGYIMQKKQLEAHPDDYGTPDVLPIGTGPMKLMEFVPDERVVLERFDGYWGTKSPVQRITIKPIVDQQTRLLAMRNGDIDGTFDVPVSELDQWQNAGSVDVITAPSNGVYLLTFDQNTKPFDDVHVRRAISYAMDKSGLVQGVLKGHGQPALAINPPGMWAGVLSEDEVNAFYATLQTYDFDLDKAKQELSQSSVPDGFTFSVQSPNTDKNMTNSLLSLSQNLKQIGVTLNVKEVDYGQWLDTYFAHQDLGVQIMAYFPDYADPANYPYLFLYSGNAAKNGMNGSNYSNPEVDKAIETSLQSSDTGARADAIKTAIQISAEDAAVLPIFWPDSGMAIKSEYRLDGYSAFWYNIPWILRGFGRAS